MRYRERRLLAVEQLGGKCNSCGSTDSLEFDHVDRSTKEQEISYLLAKAGNDRLNAELDKCQLLCKSCHKAKTDSELGIEHGGGAMGKKGCKCEPCKIRKKEYMRAYWQSYKRKPL